MPAVVDFTSSTLRKLKSALSTLDDVRAKGFPSADASDALELIRTRLASLIVDVRRASDPYSETHRVTCTRAVEAIGSSLDIVGFMERSADLNGPVEAHGPLKRLTAKLLGEHAKLVIATTWEFVPLTLLFPELTAANFVLVGMPASEAGNTLLLPLTGHELGHNVWHRRNLSREFHTKVTGYVAAEVVRRQPDFIPESFRGDLTSLQDLAGVAYIAAPIQWAIRQCEESFCDHLGLLMFRESYLHAFSYMMTPPSSSERNYEYPSLPNRINLIAKTAGLEGIEVPEGFAARFIEQGYGDDEARAALADAAFLNMGDDIYTASKTVLAGTNLEAANPSAVAAIAASFRNVVPATGVKRIADVLNGAWKIVLSKENFMVEAFPHAPPDIADRVLNDLVLKTLEVFEIEYRQSL